MPDAPLHNPFDDSRPPFRVIAGQTAGEAGADIVSAFELLAGLPAPVQCVYGAIARRLAGTAWSGPMDQAARALAAIADVATLGFATPPYHGTRHYCEVMLTCCYLVQRHGLDSHEAQTVILAALIHDLGHDGGIHPPFVMERASFACALPALRAALVPPADLERLRWLVLATEPTEGAVTAVAASRDEAPGARPPAVPVRATELQDAVGDASFARMAKVLCEADVLPSVGLTRAHTRRLQDRLSLEWRRPLDALDKQQFAERLLGHGVIGPFFRPNVESMCRQLADAQHAAGGR